MARSHYRAVSPLIHFTPESLTYSVPLFLKRQCDRTLGSYLSLDRVWSNGDSVSFELPTVSQPALIPYSRSGIDNIKGAEGLRYALKVGPIGR
jgi:hypothetical protein